jgi:competence protein ComEC
MLLTIIISQGFLILDKQKNIENQFIVFHKSRHSTISLKLNTQLQLYSNINDSLLQNDKTITNYKIGAHIKSTVYDSNKNIYVFSNRKLLVVDSLGVYKTEKIKPSIVLLQFSPKINLERLIEHLKPELIISDGSNYKSYQERWEATCREKNIPFHRTSEKGAFIYNF